MFELRTVQPVASRFTKYIIPAAIYILVYMVRSSNIYIYIYIHTHTRIYVYPVLITTCTNQLNFRVVSPYICCSLSVLGLH